MKEQLLQVLTATQQSSHCLLPMSVAFIFVTFFFPPMWRAECVCVIRGRVLMRPCRALGFSLVQLLQSVAGKRGMPLCHCHY